MRSVHYRSMMSSSDAIIWNIEHDPRLRSTVGVVWILDREPTPARMEASVARMVAAIPRLRQRVVAGRPRPIWVEVDGFDPGAHVTVDDLPGGDLDDVVALAERRIAEPFDRSRPLWRLGLVRGLADGRVALVITIHHAIADGLGMLLMLGAFADLERDPADTATPENVVPMPVRREVYSPVRRLATKTRRAAASVARSPLGAPRDAGRIVASAARLVWPHRTPLSEVMTDRSTIRRLDTRSVPLTRLKEAGGSSASVNDVFVTIVADALRRYHERLGVSCRRLRFHIPVNARTARTADLAGNEFVPARVVLPIDPDDTLQLVRDRLARLRAEPALRHVTAISAALHRVGRRLSRAVLGGMMLGVDVLASNVPGPPFPIYVAGARIDRFVAFGPPAGAAVNITLLSYDGGTQLGITTDPAAVADRELFLACIDDAIDEHVARQAPVAVAG